MIKTFRGLLADGGQDTINLHTNDGKTGYRIVKFEQFPEQPGIVTQESVMKIYKSEQSTVDGLVNFSDTTLLAAAFYAEGHSTSDSVTNGIVSFDREIFNQDIYITHSEVNAANQMNYYIELEQISLDLNEATVATLQNIREHTPYNDPT